MIDLRRYSLRNTSQMIEFPRTRAGLEEAKQFRSDNPEFKRRQITDVLQVYPDKIQVGTVYSLVFDYRLDT